MKYYLCSYAKFICGIVIDEKYEGVIEEFSNEYLFYYDLKESRHMEECDATIHLVENAFEGDIKSDEICIHSSHSKNKKYLLDGSFYMQKDASIFANIKKNGEKIYYYIEKSNIKIYVDLRKKEVFISGEKIYGIFQYVFETLLSISIEHNHGIQIHAACCEWKGKGYIITGKSGGGKTTLLFNMIKEGAKFHSNDRVAIFKETEGYVAYSIPIPVNVPINTLRTLGDWKNEKVVKSAENDTKIRFLVKDLEKLFGDKRIVKTKIEEFIICNYDKNKSSEVEIISENIYDNLEILSPYDENHPKWLPIFDYPDVAKVKKEVEKMNDDIHFIRVTGKDIFTTISVNIT